MSPHPNGTEPTRLHDLWTEQDTSVQEFTPEVLARSAAALDARVRKRNMLEYIAAGAVIVVCVIVSAITIAAGISDGAEGIALGGMIALAVGAAVVAWQLHARTGQPRAASGQETTLDAMRGELVRQRDALKAIWSWYLLPFAPGLILIYGADFFRPEANPALSLGLLVASAGLGLFVGWINHMAARQIDTEIRRIDAERAP
ncbi:hypothetical protein [Pelagibacterium sp.]|uniref:hypothetical protein n=1 Tax=Pelagibacterium sp. TaxID=1967288 RepID=UPI003A8DB1E8